MKSRIATLAQDIDVLYADVSGDEASRKQLFGVIQGLWRKSSRQRKPSGG
jgi:hypothetical protein